jgi:hypothetical protein
MAAEVNPETSLIGLGGTASPGTGLGLSEKNPPLPDHSRRIPDRKTSQLLNAPLLEQIDVFFNGSGFAKKSNQ